MGQIPNNGKGAGTLDIRRVRSSSKGSEDGEDVSTKVPRSSYAQEVALSLHDPYVLSMML